MTPSSGSWSWAISRAPAKSPTLTVPEAVGQPLQEGEILLDSRRGSRPIGPATVVDGSMLSWLWLGLGPGYPTVILQSRKEVM